MSRRKRLRGSLSVLLGTALTASLVGVVGPSAQAAGHVLPGNESDVGVYTNGQSDSMDIGDPSYSYVAETASALAPGVPFTAGSMYQRIFDRDLAAGGTDYYLDRVLGVKGTLGPTILQTRGRSLYMRGTSAASFTTMGFAGTAYAGGPNNLGNLYTVTVPGQTVTEVSAERFNAPSHMADRYTIGSTGVTADLKKFITYDNVAVTAITFKNPGSAPATFTVRAASPLAASAGNRADELTGTRTLTSGANNGLVDTPWSKVTIDLTAKGFSRSGANLDREVTVPAGGSVDVSVVGALYSATMPDSPTQFRHYADLAPADAFREGVTEFNRRWASDIPYVNVPDPAIEKAIVYRWWGERYNSLDVNQPGYVYQYPTTIEGVNLYQNAIVLTQPMHLQDTKWIRNPYLAYGQILNVGELSGSSAFLDSPGHTSWNNHYSQYIGTAGLEAYQVHGGGAKVANRFAGYFEGDGKGQLEHYDGNKNNLIAYDTNYMPGNDADAISFGFPKSGATAPGSRTIERPESAYVWGDFDAARQLYEIAGADQAKVSEMATQANAIRDSVIGTLWSTSMRMFLAATSYGATSGASSGGKANPLPTDERNLIPARESNLYDVYAQNLIPEQDAAQYADGFRFLRYGDNFPIFPFYTANQYDRSGYGIGGSNNFSNINFTVQYRGVRSALRHYDPDHKYVTPAYAERLLQWMAWSIYPGGDLRAPNQAEYYSNWNATTKSYNRNNPYHVMLGNMNYIYVEDMAGLQPRSDDVIELWPVDLGYDHFMVNNLRYHNNDVTIVWDQDGSHYGMGTGYSLFLNGEKKVTTDKLGKLTYNPNTGNVTVEDGVAVTTAPTGSTGFPTAKDTVIDDARVVSYLKTAGIDLTEKATNLAPGATLSSSFTQQGARPTPWMQFHTPGWSTSTMNYTPGATKQMEHAVSLAALVDGQTVNDPHWGNYGTSDADGYIDVDFGAPTTFDNIKVWFMSDRQAGGYHEPARYTIQLPDGKGGWSSIPEQFKAPKIAGPKFNEALFHPVTTDKVRVAFTNSPTYYTAISEIQVFNSGRDVPAVVNDPPTVTAGVDATKNGNLSTTLVANATDDGIPENGTLTYGWELVSAPTGASVIFTDASALTTTVTGTAEGSYTFRFWANDGQLRSTKDVTVTLTPKSMVAEFGALGKITTSGSASWEDPSKVNAASTPASSSPGAGNGWGTWGQARNGTSPSAEAFIQYTWDSPVLATSTDIYWYDDNGGTRTPRADTWIVESSVDGKTWTPVTLTGTSSYATALAKNGYNHLDFEATKASALRIRIWGVQSGGAGTGILRWRVGGDTVASVASPVIMRTTTGAIPALPKTLDVTYSSGYQDSLDFTWQKITPDMVAEPNVEPFVVYGTNTPYGLLAEAQIYVRPETSTGGISIQGVEQPTRTVTVGELPKLPRTVLVSYNDGSRDNQAVTVNWHFDESLVQTPGVYTIPGDLVLPDYVGTAGAVSTTLTLTVTAPDSIYGSVTDSHGNAISGVRVTVYDAKTGAPVGSPASTNDAGYYLLPVGAGAYAVCFDGASAAGKDGTGFVSTCATGVTVAAKQAVVLDRELAAAPARVTCDPKLMEGGNAGPGACADITWLVGAVGATSGTEAGTFQASKPATSGQLALWLPSLGLGAGPVDRAADKPVTRAELSTWLQAAGVPAASTGDRSQPTKPVTVGEAATLLHQVSLLTRVAGTVSGPDGSGVAGVTVILTGAGAVEGAYSTTTDSQGAYAVPGVAAGSYTVCFDVSGAAGAPEGGYAFQCHDRAIGGTGAATVTVDRFATTTVDARLARPVAP